MKLNWQVFQWLEQPHELEQSAILQKRVIEEREELVRMWDNNANSHQPFDHSVLNKRMTSYEEALQVFYKFYLIKIL